MLTINEGSWKYNKRHGHGKHTFGNGAVYDEGSYIDNSKHGQSNL